MYEQTVTLTDFSNRRAVQERFFWRWQDWPGLLCMRGRGNKRKSEQTGDVSRTGRGTPHAVPDPCLPCRGTLLIFRRLLYRALPLPKSLERPPAQLKAPPRSRAWCLCLPGQPRQSPSMKVASHLSPQGCHLLRGRLSYSPLYLPHRVRTEVG